MYSCNLNAVYKELGYTTSKSKHCPLNFDSCSCACYAEGTVVRIARKKACWPAHCKMQPNAGHPGVFGILYLTCYILRHTRYFSVIQNSMEIWVLEQTPGDWIQRWCPFICLAYTPKTFLASGYAAQQICAVMFHLHILPASSYSAHRLYIVMTSRILRSLFLHEESFTNIVLQTSFLIWWSKGNVLFGPQGGGLSQVFFV